MIPDEERPLFLRQEYRFASASDAAIKAVNPKAREIELKTQLSETDAQAMAEKYLSVNEKPRVFTVEIEGVLDIATIVGGLPSFTPNFPDHALTSGRLVLVSASIDHDAGITTIEVRG